MQLFRGTEAIYPDTLKKAVVTIGNFDGCHRGHQEIFRRVRSHAARIGGAAVVFTFHPHPASVVKGITPQLIFTLDEKIRAVDSLGMDALIIAPFTREFAETQPEVFVKETIVRRIGAAGVVVGHDFSFGRRALGDIPFLKRMGAKMGFFVECVDPVSVDGQVISSTYIRKLIQSGDVAAAARVMLHPYRITGRVIHGMARGRSLGFPTANIQPDKALLPAYGVYAVRIISGQNRWDAVANIGNNPTFGDVGTSIEAFLFDFEGDLYDAELSVEFVEHVRGEVKFADIRYLVEQIEQDCRRAREILAGKVPPR
ncbi:MAG TPA: bifunctional riboflavin kinase/FAD synthetase [Deltaproteobacteria bacterium]|nr:bifunctional riboflavin kinase/FAD synthetase [Deltaproteobacteria bacterium]